MKVKVNIINTWFLLMSEAVTVPSLMDMTSIPEKSLARDTSERVRRLAQLSAEVSDLADGEILFFCRYRIKKIQNTQRLK